MFVPSVQIVVLIFLLISEFNQVIVELGEHIEVSKSDMGANKKGSILQIFLQMLS